MNYYALLVALVLVTALLMHGNREKNLKYVIVSCLLLFAIYGLRDTYRIGDDSVHVYGGGYLASGRMSWKELLSLDIENKGYYVLNKLVYMVTNGDYQAFITILSAYVMICFGIVVYRYSPDPLQSVLYYIGLLLFTFHFSALKQSAAMATLMLAFDQIFRKRPIRFLLLVLLAGTFHFPAVVFLPAYGLSKVHFGRFYLLFLAALLVVVYVFRNEILSFMFTMYHDEEVTVDLSGIRFLRNKAVVMLVIIVAAIMFRFPEKEDRIYETLLVFMGLAVVFQTFCGYNNIFERLADYYFQFAILLIPMVFDKHAGRKALFSWRFMAVVESACPYLFCTFAIVRFLTYVVGDKTLYPYYFFFQA